MGNPISNGTTTSADCPFCAPAEGQVFHRSSTVLGLWERDPAAPGHALIVTKRHVANWFDATESEQQALAVGVKLARNAIALKFPSVRDYTVGIDVGPSAGQTVPHVHVHVIPRRPGDVADPKGGVRNLLVSRPAPAQPAAAPPPPVVPRAPPAPPPPPPPIAPAAVPAVPTALTTAPITEPELPVLTVPEAAAPAPSRPGGRGSRDASRPLPEKWLTEAQKTVELLLSIPDEKRWLTQAGGKKAQIRGAAPRGGLRINGGEGGFADRTVSLADLGWVLVAEQDTRDHGGSMDEDRVARLRFVEGTPKASTRRVDTGWAISACKLARSLAAERGSA